MTFEQYLQLPTIEANFRARLEASYALGRAYAACSPVSEEVAVLRATNKGELGCEAAFRAGFQSLRA